MDLSIFLTAEAWISLLTLIFLEIVLGVDNIVFIAITTDRLPANQQKLGRKLGLAGAMVMRCVFLCFAAWLVSMTKPLFTIDFIQLGGHPLTITIRGLVLFIGGIYLVYKGIDELRSVMNLSAEKAEAAGAENKHQRMLSLPVAVGTIMVMDIVFSIDSVITAVGLANHLIIMIIAVITAVIIMMVFIDAISDFINEHVEMKILALFFITAIGVLLMLDGVGINSGIEVLDMHMEKLMVYFAMVFCLMIEIFQMTYDARLHAFMKKQHRKQLERVVMGYPIEPSNAVDDDFSDDEDLKRSL
ncbi:MAG: TerC family protein [Coriobacteriia bacterium]|nr:TerC family protein [Coriobacteriia bacterium]